MIDYYQVVETFQHEIVIKKSRFITTLVPVENSVDADAKISEISRRYSDATHNCYAYISNDIGTEQRFSDNGEPQGTAGIPMLEVLKKRNIRKTLAVVTRYFGGIKLGGSGLVRAYSDCVSESLSLADVRRFVMSIVAEFCISYTLYPRAVEIIEKYSGKICRIEYGESVSIVYAVPEDNAELLRLKLIDYSLGKINIKRINNDYIDYEI